MFYFAGFNQFLHGARDVFDGNLGIHAMLIQQIDLSVFNRFSDPSAAYLICAGRLLEGSVPAACRDRSGRPELGGDHHFVAKWRQRFADEFFVGERAVDFGGVEKSDAAVDSSVKKLGHLGFVFWGTEEKAHAHATKSES